MRHGGRGELLAEVEAVISDATDRGVPEASLLSAIRSSVSSLLVKLGRREMTVYLSYAHPDSEVVGQVAEGLKAAGIRLFHDTLSYPGESWMQRYRA